MAFWSSLSSRKISKYPPSNLSNPGIISLHHNVSNNDFHNLETECCYKIFTIISENEKKKIRAIGFARWWEGGVSRTKLSESGAAIRGN